MLFKNEHHTKKHVSFLLHQPWSWIHSFCQHWPLWCHNNRTNLFGRPVCLFPQPWHPYSIVRNSQSTQTSVSSNPTYNQIYLNINKKQGFPFVNSNYCITSVYYFITCFNHFPDVFENLTSILKYFQWNLAL